MSKPRIRAMVLCAGFGTRLRPLTWALVKPLVPLAGEPVVGHSLRALQAAGCEMAVINYHHRPQDLPRALGRNYFGLPLEYSHEEEIQGTAGALVPPRQVLSSCDAVVLINGDSYCRWPIRQIVRHHLKRGADATLLLLDKAPDATLGGGIGVDGEGRVVQMRDLEPAPSRVLARRHLFAGLHVLSPRLLGRLSPKPGDILEDLYQPLLHEGGHLATMRTRRAWHDLGTPGRYLQAALDAVKPRGLGRLWPGNWWSSPRSVISPLALIDGSAEVRSSQIDRGVEIGPGAQVVSSLVLEGARLGAGCQIRHCIVGPGARLPASLEVEKRMISRYDKRHELQDHESQMSELVYTPF